VAERTIIYAEEFGGFLLYSSCSIQGRAQNVLLVRFQFVIKTDAFAEKIGGGI
jgi:hypothetical protein